VLSWQEEGCQHQGVNIPPIAFRACKQLAHDEKSNVKGLRKNGLQRSGGNLRPPCCWVGGG
jgi:hypothetical protein